MFQKHTTKMLYYRLKSLDELNTIEAAEATRATEEQSPSSKSSEALFIGFKGPPLNPTLIEAYASFNPLNPLQSNFVFPRDPRYTIASRTLQGDLGS